MLTETQINRICAYIRANLRDQITLDGMAAIVGMDKGQFVREFKRHADCTPMRYVRHARVKIAKQMIRDGHRLADVAFECGFSSQPHFTTTFRQLTGQTPKAWQRACGTGSATQ